MARKHPLHCPPGTKRFTVLRVVEKGRALDAYDTHAGRSFAAARALATPDPGSYLDVFVTCARDAGEARLWPHLKKFGNFVRTIRVKR